MLIELPFVMLGSEFLGEGSIMPTRPRMRERSTEGKKEVMRE